MVKLETKWTVNTQLHIGQPHHLVQGLGTQGKTKQNVAGRGWEGVLGNTVFWALQVVALLNLHL